MFHDPAMMSRFNRRAMLRMLTLATLMAPLAGAHAASQVVGTVTEIKGKATGEADGKRRALRAKSAVHLSETLLTGDESRLKAVLAKKTTLKLGAKTKVTIDSFVVNAGGELAFSNGALLLDAPAQGFKKGLTIDSRYALIAVRGTRFFAGELGEAFSVFVAKGAVDVTAGGDTVRLSAGEGTDIAKPGDKPGPVRKWGQPKIDRAMALVN